MKKIIANNVKKLFFLDDKTEKWYNYLCINFIRVIE